MDKKKRQTQTAPSGGATSRGIPADRQTERIRAKILRDFQRQVQTELDNDIYKTNRFRAEKELFYHIASGDTEAIAAVARSNSGGTGFGFTLGPDKVQVGDISDEPRLQAMSMGVSAVTLYTRAALNGGLPEHIAYSLSDCYLKHLITCDSLPVLMGLSAAAMYDFTSEVYKYKYRGCGPLVRKCCAYVTRHLHDAVTLAVLAEETGKSPGYISDCFQRELGLRPTAFIRREKLSYAKHLLETTDSSVSELSERLAFPSPSAFIAYFKQQYGVTPLQYRHTLPSVSG